MAACLSSQLAAAAAPTYRLQLVRAEGAASCPAAPAVERDVAERLGRQPFSRKGQRSIEIVLERVEERWRARLYLRDAEGAEALRTIESDAADCVELGKSVALAVALAIAPELPPEVPRETPAPSQPAPCPPPPPAPPPLPPEPSVHGEVSLRGLVSPNVLPSPAVGGALSVTLRGRLLGAAFGGLFFPQNELRSDAARLGFGLSAGFVSGCLWARSSDPQVWSCLGARLGALHTVVFRPEPVHPGDRFWWAASSELGLRQHFLGRGFVELGVAAIFPLVRHRFQVDVSSTPIYEQGPALAEAFLGLGLRLD